MSEASSSVILWRDGSYEACLVRKYAEQHPMMPPPSEMIGRQNVLLKTRMRGVKVTSHSRLPTMTISRRSPVVDIFLIDATLRAEDRRKAAL